MKRFAIILAIFATVTVFAQDDMSGQKEGAIDQMSENSAGLEADSGAASSSTVVKNAEWENIDLGPQAGVWNEIRDIFKPESDKEKFQPLQSAKTSEKPQAKPTKVRLPILNGVMVGSDKDRVAILGNNMVREGDQVEGFRVRSIKNNRITLVREGEEYVLFVKE
ncbi:MAG: hypothetical protein PHV05_06210 [Candidatus Riflebacteria bacterium]|nr:hypothetical protein [Candidatus Riflebacteria bacterium]